MLPAYIRIHDKIKADVDDGTWKIGQRLPSERDLCDTFDVSRMTVRQAITLLVDEGILERKPGSGTFVASSRVKEKMRGTTSFTEIVKSQGKKPSSELISDKRVHPNEFEIKNLAKHLKVKTGDALLSLTQISFLQDGQAFEYVRSYYVGDRFEFYLENN